MHLSIIVKHAVNYLAGRSSRIWIYSFQFLLVIILTAIVALTEIQRVQITNLELALSKDHRSDSDRATTSVSLEEPLATISFPQQMGVSPLLARINNTALKLDLKTDTAEYLVESDDKTGLGSTEVSLTLKGDYPKIRRFLVTALSDTPTLSINKISLNRSSIGETELNAQLQYRLYWSTK